MPQALSDRGRFISTIHIFRSDAMDVVIVKCFSPSRWSRASNPRARAGYQVWRSHQLDLPPQQRVTFNASYAPCTRVTFSFPGRLVLLPADPNRAKSDALLGHDNTPPRWISDDNATVFHMRRNLITTSFAINLTHACTVPGLNPCAPQVLRNNKKEIQMGLAILLRDGT